LLEHTRCYAGIPEVLDALTGRLTMAVLTNKPLGATEAILDGLGIARHFSGRVIGGDGPFPRKPDPAGLRHVIEGAAVTAAETIVVGDSVIDWRTAHAARARSCIARYGCGFAGFPVEQLTGTDRVIDRPEELLNAL
jgi:phosphoglycolate phosphatase